MKFTPTELLSSVIKHLRNNGKIELAPFDEEPDDIYQFAAKDINVHYLAVVENVFKTEFVLGIVSIKDICYFNSVWMELEKLPDNGNILKLDFADEELLDGIVKAQAVFSKYCKDDEDPDIIPSDVIQLRIK